MSISVIIPVYNEEKNIEPLYKELIEVLKTREHEIVFVDDGSTDGSFSILEQIYSKQKHIKIIKLRRNFGQTAAIRAGIESSKGDIIITMDADMQNDPKDIDALIKKLDEGYDVVSGWRRKRKDSVDKNAPSGLSNMLARKLTGLKIHDFGCTLKAYKREALMSVKLYRQMHRYIPALLHAKGYRIGEVEVTHRERRFGKTKYGIGRILYGASNLMYIWFWSKFSTRPLHFFALLAFWQFLLAGLILTEQFIMMLFIWKTLVVGPLFLLSAVLITTALITLMFGILGEILVRAYYENSSEKPYTVKETLSRKN